jgi:hypothetical protein
MPMNRPQKTSHEVSLLMICPMPLAAVRHAAAPEVSCYTSIKQKSRQIGGFRGNGAANQCFL